MLYINYSTIKKKEKHSTEDLLHSFHYSENQIKLSRK